MMCLLPSHLTSFQLHTPHTLLHLLIAALPTTHEPPRTRFPGTAAATDPCAPPNSRQMRCAAQRAAAVKAASVTVTIAAPSQRHHQHARRLLSLSSTSAELGAAAANNAGSSDSTTTTSTKPTQRTKPVANLADKAGSPFFELGLRETADGVS